jgi:hypothetical protein
MRSAGIIVGQIALVAVGLALIGGLTGGLIAQFATSHGFLSGISYGIIIAGVMVGFLAARSGSPSEMAREGGYGFYPALPQSPYQFVLGGLLALGGGLALLTVTPAGG